MSKDLDIPFRGIVEQSLAGIYVIQDEVFVYVNATFSGMLGYTPEEMTGMHLRQAVVPELQDETIRNFHRRVSGEVPSIRYTTVGKHKLGFPVTLDVHGSNLQYRGQPAVVGVGVNISEQVLQQEELRISRERLRELAEYINTAREEQRTRIARELHDVVGGMLTSMKLDVQRIARKTEDPQLKNIVADLLALAQESIDTVRSISEDLRPGVLDHLGLPAALRAALRQFSERTEIASELTVEDFDEVVSQPRETAVYRICQEALTNIAKHANATHVHVRLYTIDRQLKLEIKDNGRGISNSTPTGKSIGLLSMAERARELGGSLTVERGERGGACLQMNIPLEERHD